MIVGVISGTAGWGDSAVAGRLHQVLSRTDAKWMRESIHWNQIEPSPGA